MRPADGHDQSGFTLIEVTVVLAILAAVAGVVLTRGPAHSARLDVRSATSLVAGALRLARTRAIATNRPIAVAFDPAHATLRVGGDPIRALPRGTGMALVTVREAVPAISFFPDGSSTGGRVEVAEGSARAEIGVDWLTGRVSVGPDA